jgi:hypothetical protein
MCLMKEVDHVCFLVSGGSDLYAGIPARRIYANGRSIYLYMEEGEFQIILKYSVIVNCAMSYHHNH